MAKVPHFSCACLTSEVVVRAKDCAEKAEKTGAALLVGVLLLAGLAQCAPARPVTQPALPEAHNTQAEHAQPHGWRESDSLAD